MKVLDKSNLIFYLVLISIVCFLVFIDFSFINDFIFYIVFFNIITDVIFKFLIEKFGSTYCEEAEFAIPTIIVSKSINFRIYLS